MTPERRPILRLLLLAVLLGLGIQVVALSVGGWGVSVTRQFGSREGRSENFTVLIDGTPVIVSRSLADHYDEEGRTLEGEPVPRERLDRTAYGVSLNDSSQKLKQFGRPDWSNRLVAFSDCRNPAEFWLFVHTGRAQGQGYFEGYDSETKFRVGYIGRNGPTNTKPPPEERFVVDGRQLTRSGHLASDGTHNVVYDTYHFSSGYRTYVSDERVELSVPPWSAYLRCGKELVEVNLREQTVRTVRVFDKPFTIGLGRQTYPIDEEDKYKSPDFDEFPWCREHLLIRTLDRITLLDPRSDAEKVYQIPEAARGSRAYLYQLADGTGILHVSRRSKGGITSADIYWIDGTEKVLRDAHLELVTGRPPTDPRLKAARASLIAPVPAVWTVSSFVMKPLSFVKSGRDPSYSAALARSLRESWPALLISFAITAVAVWWCAKWQKQHAADWTRTWVVFVVLFGLPALLGYLLHRTWPPRVECPTCKEPAPRDRLSCAACEADFPEPAPKGIEVFA